MKKEIKKYPIKFTYSVIWLPRKICKSNFVIPTVRIKDRMEIQPKGFKRKLKKDALHFTYLGFGCQEKFVNQTS